MYNISRRKSLTELTGTPANVGPGAYYLCSSLGHVKESCAPFLTGASRYSEARHSTDVFYNSKYQAKNIKYGHVLRNTDAREFYRIQEGPAPNAYNPKIITKKCTKIQRKPGIGKIYFCRVPLTSGPTGPSIPTELDQNGYDISDLGVLIKLPPEDYDQTIGPAFYDVPTGEPNFNSLRYRGCAWSKMQGGRSRLVTSDNPGPGHYELLAVCSCPRREYDEKLRAQRRMATRIPRYTEAMMMRVEREGRPAPGDYEVIDFENLKKLRKWTNFPIAFQSCVDRFHPIVDDLPGPGRYEYCDCALLKQYFSTSDAPFGVQSSRFKSKTSVTPGPGSYEARREDCNKKKYFGLVSRPPFGSKAKRDDVIRKDNNIGPSEYVVNECSCEDNRMTSIFRSSIPRFPIKKPEKPSLEETIPSKRPFTGWKLAPRLKKTPPAAFLTKEPKFGAVHDVTFQALPTVTPDPGSYETKLPVKSAGHSFPLEKRTTFQTTTTPGPGQYSVSDSMIRTRTSHNVRLMKLVNQKLNRPRKKSETVTPKPGDKKLLRWFASKPEEYKHCL